MSVLRTETKSYRNRVEVIVFRIGKLGYEVAVIEAYPGVWMFPGGGVEQDESYEAACAKETLEEAGLAFKDLKPLISEPIVEEIFTRREGQEGYTHTSSIYYTAMFTHTDMSLFNREGDGAKVHWLSRGVVLDRLNETRQEMILETYNHYLPEVVQS